MTEGSKPMSEKPSERIMEARHARERARTGMDATCVQRLDPAIAAELDALAAAQAEMKAEQERQGAYLRVLASPTTDGHDIRRAARAYLSTPPGERAGAARPRCGGWVAEVD